MYLRPLSQVPSRLTDPESLNRAFPWHRMVLVGMASISMLASQLPRWDPGCKVAWGGLVIDQPHNQAVLHQPRHRFRAGRGRTKMWESGGRWRKQQLRCGVCVGGVGGLPLKRVRLRCHLHFTANK